MEASRGFFSIAELELRNRRYAKVHPPHRFVFSLTGLSLGTLAGVANAQQCYPTYRVQDRNGLHADRKSRPIGWSTKIEWKKEMSSRIDCHSGAN